MVPQLVGGIMFPLDLKVRAIAIVPLHLYILLVLNYIIFAMIIYI